MYDIRDERGVPISSGVPPIVIAAGLIGLVIIFTLASLVIWQAEAGHVWPASHSVKLPL